MKRLPSGCEGNPVVNWNIVFGQRVREFSARNVPVARAASQTRALWRSRLARAESRTCRKPLYLLAETREPREAVLSGFFVNWTVAQFRYQI